jgi:hypothetical protein
MWNLSLKIYGSANATVLVLALVIALFSPLMFLSTVALSLVVSLPAIPALYSVFHFVQERKPPVVMCWLILLAGNVAISLLPVILFSALEDKTGWGDQLYTVSMLAGFAGVCLRSSSIHEFFLQVKYSRHEND